jgi:hypothetical protein
MELETIAKVWPDIKARVVTNEFGTMIVLTGKNCKVVANHLARENYLNGYIDTRWQDVRHGIGYAVPLYDNPLNKVL